MIGLGVTALLFWSAHAAFHLARGTAGDLLWACNVAVPVLAIGCFLRSGTLCACAVMCLAFGLPMWALDLATGGDFVPTSLLTHVGGLALGAVAVRRLGWPRGSWRLACGGTALLVAVTRLVGSPERNANLAFRVHDGWERHFASHLPYLAAMWLASAVAFFVLERAASRMRLVR